MAASSANASGYYIGLFGGISSLEDDWSVSTSTAGAAGTTSKTGKVVWYSGTVGSVFAGANGLTTKPTWDSKQNPLYDTGTSKGTNAGATGMGGFGFSTKRTNVTVARRVTTLESSGGFDDGWVVGASLGWDFGNGFRNELEVAYRNHDLESSVIDTTFSRVYTGYTYGLKTVLFLTYKYSVLTYVGLNTISKTGTFTYANLRGKNKTSGAFSAGTKGSGAYGNVQGDLETWSFMYNVWYDFDFGDSPIRPFIGGGIGFAHASLEFDMTTDGGLPTKAGYGFFGTGGYAYRGNGEATDWGFAYQLGAGLGYDLGNGMMLSAQYRYFNTGAMDLSLADQIEVNLESHNFLVGLNVPLGGGM